MIIKSEDMIGRIFRANPLDNGERHQEYIVKCINDNFDKLENSPERIKLCSFNNDSMKISFHIMASLITLTRMKKIWGMETTTHKSTRGTSANNPSIL